MEKILDIEHLYQLQDRVFNILSKIYTTFYLAGGTALHRFYYNARYSYDLDFFTQNNPDFSQEVREFIELLDSQDLKITKEVQTRDFFRIRINKVLQVDFVNGRVYRHGKSNIIDNLKVDNKINIFTNKISAIIDRDEEKDVFDFFCFVYNEKFNWREILDITNKKSFIEKEALAYRLKTFPLNWLKRLKTIKEVIITREEIERVSNDILQLSDNSLYVQKQT
ncbi:hypothetical protein JCM13304A_02440 [Desulfothermus okinawensis JCM 13304]